MLTEQVFVGGPQTSLKVTALREPFLLISGQEPEAQLAGFVEWIQIVTSIQTRLEMKMRRRGPAGGPHQSDHVATRDGRARLDPLYNLRQVRVVGLIAAAVIQDDQVSETTAPSRKTPLSRRRPRARQLLWVLSYQRPSGSQEPGWLYDCCFLAAFLRGHPPAHGGAVDAPTPRAERLYFTGESHNRRS